MFPGKFNGTGPSRWDRGAMSISAPCHQEGVTGKTDETGGSYGMDGAKLSRADLCAPVHCSSPLAPIDPLVCQAALACQPYVRQRCRSTPQAVEVLCAISDPWHLVFCQNTYRRRIRSCFLGAGRTPGRSPVAGFPAFLVLEQGRHGPLRAADWPLRQLPTAWLAPLPPPTLSVTSAEETGPGD